MSPNAAFVPTALPTSTRASLTHASSTIPTQTPASFIPTTSHRPLAAPLRHAHLTSPPPSAPSPAKSPSRILLWFHTDLRTDDNPALLAAARAAAVPGGCLVPVASGASLDAIAAPLLAELKANLAAAGSDLLAVPGVAVADVLIKTCKKLNLNAVYFNRSVLPARVAVEKLVAKLMQEAGIAIETFWGNVLRAPATDVCAAKHDPRNEKEHAFTAISTRLSSGVASPENAPGRLPKLPAAAKQMQGQRVVEAKIGGGTARAVRVLGRMQKRTEKLALDKTPDLAVQLKDFLDYGAISPRMVAQKTVQVTGGWKGRTFSELVWREYVCFAAHRGAGVATRERVAVF